MTQDKRLQELTLWINETWPDATLTVASADASFRRYFRIHNHGDTMIAMDAPPEKEDSTPFVEVTQRLLDAGVHAPEILKKSLKKGFLVLSDLGTTPYLDKLNSATADDLYGDALHTLLKIQQASTKGLPTFDADLLQQEMQLMPEWFLTTHLGLGLDDEQEKIIQQTFDDLSAAILEQPQVFVHRDYHSRNLMLVPENNPAVIDYQDAVLGAITYDLVSILRDCYIAWPNSKVEQWALSYRDSAVTAGLMSAINDTRFIKYFDLMGLQRHLKVLGIFARLCHRDGKKNYLNDLPLTLSYVMEVGKKHPETQALIALFEQLDIPSKIGTVEL
ncbi:MAG TPA: aminoglycoside phosphotransferase [Leucothrix mucor]|nr:aminoglycoside phosphotransferase [Leucothrix mucor]